MNEQFAKIFGLAQKDHPDNIFQGDDIHMSSVSPYGIPTGLAELDLYLGQKGGLPAGKIVEYFGFQMCLAKDTHVNYNVRSKKGKIQNSKGGTIERLYRRFHKLSGSKQGEYQRPQTTNSYFTAPSMNEDCKIIHNKIIDVVKTGEKECFSIKTMSGEEIHATVDHKFHVGSGYVSLNKLKVGHTLLIHNNTIAGKGDTTQSELSRKLRKMVYVQHHPLARTKIINGKYEYKVLSKARAVFEAYLNKLTLNEYKDRLNKGTLDGLNFVPKDQHIHHIDENYLNDSIENLIMLTPSKHLQLHTKGIAKYAAVFDEIISITPIGIKETYDLKMKSPYHNYVANRFVVSNCGKTTAALQAAAEWQKRGGIVYFIDSEISFDPKRARELGCDPSKIIVAPTETVEEIFELLFGFIDNLEKEKVDAPVLFIIDSITGVPTKSDLEGDISKNERVAFEAKQIRRGVKKLNAKLGKIKCKPTTIFINHAYEKIVSFGKRSDSGGGHGTKFFAAVRIEFTAIGNIVNKAKDKRLGQKIKLTIIKLKGAHLEYNTFNADLTNELGFDKYESLKLAMISSGMADRPKSSQVITFLPGTGYETQITQKDFRGWIDQSGGYDKVYQTWRKWAIENRVIIPWGVGE